MSKCKRVYAAIFFLIMLCPSLCIFAAPGEWVNISDGVLKELTDAGKKIGYPGMTAGVATDPGTGDVYMVVCDHGLWKSSDAGMTFKRIDGGKIGGRCETGFALNFDPAGKRLACFMIYGSCASTEDAGENWKPWKTNHLDFGAVDWEATGKSMIAIRHESGGVMCVSDDSGQTWKNLGQMGADKKVVKEDREFTGLGMFDASVFMAARGKEIIRSTDAGKTWAKAADFKPAAPVMKLKDGVGYWVADQGVMISKDKGTTWAAAWPVKAVFGPWFGSAEKQIVVVGKEGFMESRDGGATWKNVAPLPTGFNVQLVGPNYAWDRVHNIFYASSMGKPTLKFERPMK